MDPLALAYFTFRYGTEFTDRKASSFQNFFNTVMEMGYPGDFIRIKAWGKKGDEKNDGLLKSKKMLFQVYAPERLNERKTVTKVTDDFWGALGKWKGQFSNWVFVHNSREGISSGIQKCLSNLENNPDNVKTTSWGFEEIRIEVFRLSHEQLCILFGNPPSTGSFQNIGYDKLKIVLENIARKPPLPDAEIRPVPKEKIQINGLSQDVETLLKAGMKKSKLVQDFFKSYHDPSYGEDIAQAFHEHYNELKKLNHPPDDIFSELLDFAGGTGGDVGNLCAALAVLAYLFEECDIFEEMRVVKNDTSNKKEN